MLEARPKERIRSFAPIAGRNARVLVLGSMPGAESLRRKEYYAHPRNQFWDIAANLFDTDRAAPYAARVAALKANRVAVWDVLRSCVREGSMDARIGKEIANDFRAFFRRHRGITHVFFNGAKAEASYRRHVLSAIERPIRYTRLPSTSPAHASLPRASKLAAWRAVRGAART